MTLNDQAVAALQNFCDEVTNVLVHFTNTGVDTTKLQAYSTVLHGQLQSNIRNPTAMQLPAEPQPAEAPAAEEPQAVEPPEHHWGRKKK